MFELLIEKNVVKEQIKQILDSPAVCEYFDEYIQYRQNIEDGKLGKTAQFWIKYCNHIWLCLKMSDAVKRNDFWLYLQCLYEMADIFFTYSGQNYARYTTFSALQLANVENTHKGATKLLRDGCISVARSYVPGSRVAVDRTIEETFNKHAKSRGGMGAPGFGVSGIAANDAAYQRWVRTTHRRTKLMELLLSQAGINNPSTELHKDLSPKEVKRSNEKVLNCLEVIKCFVNPFNVDKEKLVNIASERAVEAGSILEKDILEAEVRGREQKLEFIHSRLKKNTAV